MTSNDMLVDIYQCDFMEFYSSLYLVLETMFEISSFKNLLVYIVSTWLCLL